MSGTASLTLVDNTDKARFELWDGDTMLGLIGYEIEPASMSGPKVYRLMHTVVEVNFGRQGIARLLVTMVLTRLRFDGAQIAPVCSYVQRYLGRFPEYKPLVARGR